MGYEELSLIGWMQLMEAVSRSLASRRDIGLLNRRLTQDHQRALENLGVPDHLRHLVLAGIIDWDDLSTVARRIKNSAVSYRFEAVARFANKYAAIPASETTQCRIAAANVAAWFPSHPQRTLTTDEQSALKTLRDQGEITEEIMRRLAQQGITIQDPAA